MKISNLWASKLSQWNDILTNKYALIMYNTIKYSSLMMTAGLVQLAEAMTLQYDKYLFPGRGMTVGVWLTVLFDKKMLQYVNSLSNPTRAIMLFACSVSGMKAAQHSTTIRKMQPYADKVSGYNNFWTFAATTMPLAVLSLSQKGQGRS